MNWKVLFVVSAASLSVFILLYSLFKPQRCANTLSCKESLTLQIDNDSVATFGGETITPPKIDLAEKISTRKILGEAVATGEKRIEVDLSTQTLTAYQGDVVFMQAIVSSGKWYPTPTGEFKIWSKFRATKMSGGEGADYYYLPNVPYTMFFSGSGIAPGRGFALHGAYWHNNFGHAMSHGCVNMRTTDAEKLFYWADSPPDADGTKITIYGQAP